MPSSNVTTSAAGTLQTTSHCRRATQSTGRTSRLTSPRAEATCDRCRRFFRSKDERILVRHLHDVHFRTVDMELSFHLLEDLIGENRVARVRRVNAVE
jgi:hypothetical protein